MDTTKPLVEIMAEFEVSDEITRRYLRHLRDMANEDSDPENSILPTEKKEIDSLEPEPSALSNVNSIEDLLEQIDENII